MRHNPLPLFLAVVAIVALAGLLLTPGCGRNEARVEPVTSAVEGELPSDVADDAVISLQEREATLELREQELTQLAGETEARLGELEARLADVEAREAVLDRLERAVSEAEVARQPVPVVEPPAIESPPPPEPEPQTVMVKLPAATRLRLEFLEPLSSETSLAGDPVRAMLAEDVVGQGGLVALPAGSTVLGTVTEAVAEKKIGGQARLALRFDKIATPAGYRAAIEASLDASGRPQKKKDAATIGGSAAGGAILGRVLSNDRDKGTVIGGIIGAAIGTAAARANKGDPVLIEAGSRAVVELELPIHVAVTRLPQDETPRS